MKEKGVGKRKYTEELKAEAVRLVDAVGVNETARRLGAPTALKVERLYRAAYRGRQQARLDIVDWIEGFHNRRRLHSSNGFLATVVAEAMLKAA